MVVERYVQPFYLKMMRTNAVEYGAALAPDIADVGRAAGPEDVIQLLRGYWRERVMGAWLSILHREPAVTAAVLQALVTSQGSLDSPPLATAAVVLAGSAARG